MITFKPCVTYRRRDGTYAVRIRVTFKRKTAYLPTTKVAYQEQLTRSGKIKDGALLASCEALVRQMREAVAELNPYALEGKDVGWVCDLIRAKLAGSAWSLDLFDYAEVWLRGKQESTAEQYRKALRALARYVGEPHLDVNAINADLLRDFLGGYGDQPAAGKRHLVRLGALYAAARREYNDDERVRIPRDPFARLDLRLPPSQGQRSLGVEVMQRIIDARPELEVERVALAAFVVSFGTMGANFADLWAAQRFTGTRWIYERQKTRGRRADRARMEVEIDPRLAHHLEILRGRGSLWLPKLRRGNRGKDTDGTAITKALQRWAEREGLPPFSFYAARHSWATIARSIGVEKATVDEGLAHVGDFRVADIYAERDWKRINEANRRVLDCFSWGAAEP